MQQADGGEGQAGGNASGGRWLWLGAFLLIISGYIALRQADPGGQNVWSRVSPALLLCGYLLIIPAILYRYPRKG